MNRFATLILALVLAGAGSTALAEQTKDQLTKQTPKPQPVQMTDAQMDNVAGGALLNVFLVDVVDIERNNVQVAIPVNAAAAVAVLGGAVGTAIQRPGRQVATQ